MPSGRESRRESEIFRRSFMFIYISPMTTKKGKRLPPTGRFWLASCDVFSGVSGLTWKALDYGMQKLYQILLESFMDRP
jgi:hypothetical protein